MSWNLFGRRVLGALRLDSATYREVARNPTAVTQAVAVILLSSMASAIVFLIKGTSPGLSVDVNWGSYPVTRASNLAAALAGGILDGGWGLIVWAAQAAIIRLLWNRFGGGKQRARPWSSIAAPLGFANAPLIIFALLELAPVVGTALGVAGLCWTLIASVVAIRASLDSGWGRAVAYLLISALVLVPFGFLLGRLT